MSHDADALNTTPPRWDFIRVPGATEEAIDDDVGYEAALPGLQALYADEPRADA